MVSCTIREDDMDMYVSVTGEPHVARDVRQRDQNGETILSDDAVFTPPERGRV